MSICTKCGLEIKWVIIGKRWHCHNPDGDDHWDLCSQTRTAKIIATGEHFSSKYEEGYKTPLRKSGVFITRQTAKTKNKTINTAGCNYCVLPWETCPNKCPIEFKQTT